MANIGEYTTGGEVIASQAATADVTSNPIKVHPRTTSLSVHFQQPTNTDLVGSWSVQLSNDGEDWVDAAFSDDSTSVSVTSGSTTSALRSIALAGFKYARVKFTYTSHTTGGTISATVKQHKS